MTHPRIDEMVDGRGGLRPHWRQLLGAFTAMGERGIADRIGRLNDAFDEEGIRSLPHGAMKDAAWRCDPVPLPISAAEFAALEVGLAQRARLLEAVLQDVYGRQDLLAEGLLPPALVHANPAFLRPCHVLPGSGQPRVPLLHQYAVDLLRGPDGQWRVLADRAAGASGIAYARENRRVLGRVVPEAFRPVNVRGLRDFFDTWQDSLQHFAPPGRANPAIALLTPGPGHPGWFEHQFIARELSCALVEGGDLTVRNGALYLKTLRGLLPIDVLVRRVDGRLIDPLELEVHGGIGVTGLMDVVRHGAVRMLNDPGSGMVEAPALASFLQHLSMRLLGEPLAIASVPTMWLGPAKAREVLAQDYARWLIRPATDGRTPATVLADLPDDKRAALLAEIDRKPWDYAATAYIVPSQAPCGTENGLIPKPIVLRLFLVFDGLAWHTMPGGLAQVVEENARLAGRLPRTGTSKDVWVMSEDTESLVGPAAIAVPRIQIHRAAAELPSRIADNLFWFGRYMERLENSARLTRAVLRRLARASYTPRDMAELAALAACLRHAGMLDPEAHPGTPSGSQLAAILLASVREGGRIERQLARVGRLTETVRDRLTDDICATFSHTLRDAQLDGAQAGANLDRLAQAMGTVLRFCAAVAGVAAENMVRGGAWLFLDLGRRSERAQQVCSEIAEALDQPAPRIEGGLRLCLELCDSVITYRSRYLTAVQPAPVLDLVIADITNPRALAFQLRGIATRLTDLMDQSDILVETARTLAADAQSLVDDVAAAPDAEAAAAELPRLRAIAAAVSDMSDQLNRRYFALLPAAQPLGVAEEGDADAEAPSFVAPHEYRLRHATRYAYESRVDLASHMLHLTPRALPGQRVETTFIVAAPGAARSTTGRDHFGNDVTWLFLEYPHDSFEVVAESVIDVAFAPPPAEHTPPWEDIASLAREGGAGAWEAAEFIYDSTHVPSSPQAGAYAATYFTPNRPILAALLDLNAAIRRDFAFRAGVSGIGTTVAQTLKTRAGVCQDFTHLMLACLRCLGIPARYMSGYIRTKPPPGAIKRLGSDQSHAWVGAWLGPEAGWVGLDPTNDLVVSEEHVVLAWGRDYSDISPLRGIILGGGRHKLKVGVDLEPV